MKYAIVKRGAGQARAEEGQLLEVDLLPNNPGDSVELEALLVADGDTVKVGNPIVKGAKVKAVVVEHFRGEKIRVFKYKAKERERKQGGHRADYTRLKVEQIVG